MRGPPSDLAWEHVAAALFQGWELRVESMDYVPEGGGSHHWAAIDSTGRHHFVTVDDLGTKDWLGDTFDAAFDGLRRSLLTAWALRCAAGLEFVVAPVPDLVGEVLRRLEQRYSVSVFPYLAGRSYPFGPYHDAELRDKAIDLLAALHRSTPAVRSQAPNHVLSFGGRGQLEAFVADPDRSWIGGPFSESAQRMMAPHARELAHLVSAFDRLAALPAHLGVERVITHGEPHPANLLSMGDRLVLIDWDTAALAPAERDLSLLLMAADGDGRERYQRATGRELNATLIDVYQLRWYLDDLGSTVRFFSARHLDTPDTRHWWDGLGSCLNQLSEWSNRLG